jgi:hypothetical protein
VSRADTPARSPGLGRTARQAALDLYYNFSSFIPANLIFGVGLVALIGAASNPALGGVVAIGLVLVTAGCMALATSLVRDGHTDLGVFMSLVRHPWPALGLGLAQLAVGLVLIVDLFVGAGLGMPVGGVLMVSALYGLAILWTYAVVAWPIVLDPNRRDVPLAARLRLAAMLLVARPGRMAGLAALVGIFLGIATVAVAAIVTFALALAWLVVARYVLPIADFLEGRAAVDAEPT